MNTKQNQGFTLLEILVAVAILAVLASVAIYNFKGGDKISGAETVVLRQALMNYIPEQIKLYYLRADSTAWTNRVAHIQNEMANWPHLQSSPRTATVYKNDGITLKFRTSYQDQKNNEQLRDILIKSPIVETAATSGPREQKFTVKYKLN